MANPKPKKDSYDFNKSIRVTYRTEAALDRAVAALRERADLPFRGGRVSSSSVVNASWLLLESLDSDVLASLLRPHLARLEVMLNGGEDPGFADHPEVARPVGHSKNKPRSNQTTAGDGRLPGRISTQD